MFSAGNCGIESLGLEFSRENKESLGFETRSSKKQHYFALHILDLLIFQYLSVVKALKVPYLPYLHCLEGKGH